jgi:hypothetical protein
MQHNAVVPPEEKATGEEAPIAVAVVGSWNGSEVARGRFVNGLHMRGFLSRPFD